MKKTTFRFITETDTGECRVLNVIHSTHSKPAFETGIATFKRALVGLPGVRPPTFGNVRPVRVIAISDPRELAYHTEHNFPKPLKVGDEFPSVREASLALGLKENSLKVLFSQARKTAPLSTIVSVRGLDIAFADSRDTSKALSK